MRPFVALGLIAVAAAGCRRANDEYCDLARPCETGTCNLSTNECAAEAADAGIDAAICGGDPDCNGASAPICDDGSGTCRGCETGVECIAKDPLKPECEGGGRCVECLDHATCAAVAPICSDGECKLCSDHPECADRDAAAPKCASDGLCVECVDHADCGSQVCDRMASTCVEATAIIYVAPGGSDDSGCGDVGSECASVGFAVDKTEVGRTTIHVADAFYNEAVVVNAQTVTIVGSTAARVRPASSDRAALLAINGADVTLDGMTFADATGNSDADGINCSNSAVTAYGTIITANEASGLDARNSCTVSLENVEISNNSVRGVFLDASSLRLHRSLVKDNAGGGLDINDSSFDIVNNFIILNGTSAGGGSQFGGVFIDLSSTEPTMVFEFNTVAENQSATVGGGGIAHGVYCFSSDIAPSNNIVYGGAGAGVVAGNCSWTFSNVEGAEPLSGEGNLNEDPRFEDIGLDDYHIEPGSPARDKADENATLDIDFDGDARPNGARSDMGADEVR